MNNIANINASTNGKSNQSVGQINVQNNNVLKQEKFKIKPGDFEINPEGFRIEDLFNEKNNDATSLSDKNPEQVQNLSLQEDDKGKEENDITKFLEQIDKNGDFDIDPDINSNDLKLEKEELVNQIIKNVKNNPELAEGLAEYLKLETDNNQQIPEDQVRQKLLSLDKNELVSFDNDINEYIKNKNSELQIYIKQIEAYMQTAEYQSISVEEQGQLLINLIISKLNLATSKKVEITPEYIKLLEEINNKLTQMPKTANEIKKDKLNPQEKQLKEQEVNKKIAQEEPPKDRVPQIAKEHKKHMEKEDKFILKTLTAPFTYTWGRIIKPVFGTVVEPIDNFLKGHINTFEDSSYEPNGLMQKWGALDAKISKFLLLGIPRFLRGIFGLFLNDKPKKD